MKHFTMSLTWIGLSIALCTAAPVKIIGPTNVPPYSLVELQAEGDLKDAGIIWDVSPEELVDMRELPGGKLIFTGPPGTYKVRCTIVRLKDGQTLVDRQRFTVTIGEPKPPVPPDPPVPQPDEKLVESLKSAYVQESDPNKHEQVKKLASLYRMGAESAQDKDVGTWGKLVSDMRVAASTLGIAGKIPVIQTTIATELRKSIPSTPSEMTMPLDDAGRAKAKAEFLRIATALEAVIR